MRIVGLITEYNPFHNGHKYHIEKAKLITNSEYTISVMSGNFLQRGEPALVDKWTRARMAIDNGVDLVIELPTIYACQSAEIFGYGAVEILNSIGIVDNLVFGSEIGDIDKLFSISKILVDEPHEFKKYLKKYLSKGLVFPKARSNAIIEYLNFSNKFIDNLEFILSNPNNILGIEYLKALIKTKSKIKPYTIKRIGSNYNDVFLTGNISSATAIRKSIFENGVRSIKNTVPKETYYHLEKFTSIFNTFNHLSNYNQLLMFLIRVKNDYLKNILDVENGLENRIISCFNNNNNILDAIKCIKTKRYTLTRIQRILIHILLDITNESFIDITKKGPQYIRILGASKNGLKILNKIKSNSSIPIITKFSNYKRYNNPSLNKMLELDKLATDIYFLGIDTNRPTSNMDYKTNPYIKKE